ncbi:MAG: hypothetical protein AABZ60_00880 [Planctomycetota bacterium]
MNLMFKTIPISIFLLVFSGFSNADTIHLKRGKPIEGCKVKKETWTEVKYALKGLAAEAIVKREDIDRIDYDDIPDPFKQAEASMEIGSFEQAKDSYIKFLKEKDDFENSDVFEPKVYYGLAKTLLILAPSAKKKETDKYTESAEKFYLDSAEKYFRRVAEGDNPLIGDALVGLIDSRLATQDFAGAKKAADSLREKKLSDYYNMMAELYQCHITYFQKDYKEAVRKYESLAGRARRDNKVIYGIALVGKGKALVAGGTPKDAQQAFEDVLTNSDNEEALAGAYNGIGDIYRADKNHRESLLAYLHVVVLYREVHREMPKALYYAGKAFITLKDENPVWGPRGNSLLARQKEEYPAWKP